MKSRHVKMVGKLSIDGRSFEVTYDIPGIHDDASVVAGGQIWFDRKHVYDLSDTAKFQLETASGAVVQGALIRVRGSQASVMVEPF